MSQVRLLFFVLCLVFSASLKAQIAYEEAEQIEIEVHNRIEHARLESDRGDYFPAKDNLEKALELSQKINDKQTQGVIYTKLAKIEFLVDEPKKAIALLQRAESIQREIEDYANLALTYNIRGYISSSLGDYQTALDYFYSAQTKFQEEGLEQYIAEVLLNDSKVRVKLKQYEVAKQKLESAIMLSRKYDQTRILSSSLIQMGKVNCSTGNLNLALTQVEEGMEIASSAKMAETINEAYLTLSTIYEKLEDFKLSYTYLKRHQKLSDSILDIIRDNLSPEKRAQYVNQYKIAENEELKAQIDEADAESNLSRITTILSISLITILSLLTLSLYKNNNIRLKTNNMLHKKNDELIVAKEKAELASKTKANFLSTVTHELRTPLYAVTGLTNMLLEENPKKHQIPHLKSLKFSGDYLLTFINDILQINRIEANKVELDPEYFNLHKKIENVISALSNSAHDNNTVIHYEYEKGIPETFVGDQLKISQILINLLGNAIKFTKDGDIWVRVKKVQQNEDDYLLKFEVEDNGIGISKEKQENMFDSFSQGSVQINRKYGGTGLGLSIVKGLVEILKGKVYLKSELGKGTSFFFEIPLTYSEPKEVPNESEQSKKLQALDLSNIKILVVEDNKINQMITKKILNKMGLHCDIVDNGEAAVDQVKEVSYNVVLMDIHMPGISGIEATKIIRSFDKELTIFALTAVTLEDKMHEFDEAGFNDIISKPFRQEDFEKKLYGALSDTENITV
jgi:signal transduction histidine kinase/CheY-like chemotaxis protein